MTWSRKIYFFFNKLHSVSKISTYYNYISHIKLYFFCTPLGWELLTMFGFILNDKIVPKLLIFFTSVCSSSTMAISLDLHPPPPLLHPFHSHHHPLPPLHRPCRQISPPRHFGRCCSSCTKILCCSWNSIRAFFRSPCFSYHVCPRRRQGQLCLIFSSITHVHVTWPFWV